LSSTGLAACGRCHKVRTDDLQQARHADNINKKRKVKLMKKTLIALTATLALATASTSWAQQVLRLSHNAAPGNPKAVASLKFAELVEQKTEGRVKVEVGGSAQFGDDVESLTNMRLGSLAFSTNSQGSTAGVVPEFNLVGLPFLFRDLEHAYKVVDGPVGAKLDEAANKKGWYWRCGTTAFAIPATTSVRS